MASRIVFFVTLDKPVHLLLNDVTVAIDIATRVDEKRINYNFEFDWCAYEAVRRGLSQLVQKGRRLTVLPLVASSRPFTRVG